MARAGNSLKILLFFVIILTASLAAFWLAIKPFPSSYLLMKVVNGNNIPAKVITTISDIYSDSINFKNRIYNITLKNEIINLDSKTNIKYDSINFYRFEYPIFILFFGRHMYFSINNKQYVLADNFSAPLILYENKLYCIKGFDFYNKSTYRRFSSPIDYDFYVSRVIN